MLKFDGFISVNLMMKVIIAEKKSFLFTSLNSVYVNDGINRCSYKYFVSESLVAMNQNFITISFIYKIQAQGHYFYV